MNRNTDQLTVQFSRILGRQEYLRGDITQTNHHSEAIDVLQTPGFRVAPLEISEVQTETAWDRLREQLTFVLATHADDEQSPNWEMRLRSQSASAQADVLQEMRTWIRRRTDLAKKHPIFGLLAALPEHFAEMSYQSEDPEIGLYTVVNKINKNTQEKCAIAFLNGFGLSLAEYQRLASEKPEVLRDIIPLLRAGVEMNAVQWNDPEKTQVQRDLISHLEFHHANPALDEEGQKAIALADGTSELFQNFFVDNTVASWTTFLHDLTTTPERLKARWTQHEIKLQSLFTDYENDPWKDERIKAILPVLAEEMIVLFPNHADRLRQGKVKEVLIEIRGVNGGIEEIFNTVKKDLFHRKKIERITASDAIPQLKKALNAWMWDAIILPVEQAVDRAVKDPQAIEKLSQLEEGSYKDFMRYAYFLKVNQTPEFAHRLLERAPSRFGQGCDVNQTHAHMNEYVRSHYQAGVSIADREQFGNDSLSYQSAQDLYLFTDEAKDSRGREISVIPSYSARLLAVAMNSRFEQIALRAKQGEMVSQDVQDYTKDVLKFAPEAHAFRDFFLENAAHLQIDRWLKSTFSEARLKEDGITLEVRQVKLHDSFSLLSGVLAKAYMDEYPLARVRGLESAIHGFSHEEKRQLADLLFHLADTLSPSTRALYERMASELEVDLLKEEYRKWKEHTSDNEKSFEKVLERVLKNFPRASHHRDSVLRSLLTDIATTSEQADRLHKLTFTYHERHPSADPDSVEKKTFSASETMKDYLAMFSDRYARKEVLLWFFGGAMPPDRYLEGKTFQVNEQEKVRAFWALSSEERRTIFYSALLGEGGLFDCQPFQSAGIQEGGNQQLLELFVTEFSEIVFVDAFEQPKWKEAFTIVFREMFCQYSPARRVELFCAISERLREFKLHNKKFSSGEAMRLLLEQVGVVGVKTGQVLAEQPDLLDETSRQELGKLKDGAQPFDKQGVFSYVRAAGWYDPSEDRPVVAEVGSLLGSASIKQVHVVRTVDGRDLALKVQRPNITRNFAEDMRVLKEVVSRLRGSKFDVPDWLVKEVQKAVEREMDFGFEAGASKQMSASLRERGASLRVGERNLALRVPEILALHTKDTNPRRPMQLMMEEFAHGLTLEDIRRLQEPASGSREEIQKTHDRIRDKLHRLYGAAAPAIERQYKELNLEEMQSQIGIELLYQIAGDGVFHADLHAGNVMVNLADKQEQATLIDLGSAGESHPDFLELTVQVLLLKQGFGNSGRVAEILSALTEGASVEEWKAEIEQTVSRARDAKEVFTNVLALVLKKSQGNVNHDLRMLFKALSAAGGHLQVLSDRLTSGIMEGMMRSQVENRPPIEVLMENQDIQKLLPLAPRLPMLAGLLGIS